MEFGLQFFPDVNPAERAAAAYWDDALHLTGLADELGYTTVRTVEHYFHPYGGYSPDPIVFLAAASQRTRRARLVTGAVLPIFNNPLKLAGQIGMLDAISAGRLDVGFARAFLPHEFARFGRSLDESRARFEEGIEQVRRLLEDQNVSMEGRFHRFRNVTSLPRPTQKPRPPFYVAALNTEESFVWAGTHGHGVMAIPMGGSKLRDLLAAYRDAWRSSGRPGRGTVMLAFHMLCHEDAVEAVRIAREPLNRYLRSLVDAASDWTGDARSESYPGYDKIIAGLAEQTFEMQVASRSAWVGSPAGIVGQIRDYVAEVGGFEHASLQVNFNTVGRVEAEASMRLFAREVMPRVREVV
jgi:alkanesulfonate monooxygenase SsuD/methylene tetrahydromethanopterin reductase-like flavin-dependent oxidoreductase (luciferase family)